jgi:hypothetical protein
MSGNTITASVFSFFQFIEDQNANQAFTFAQFSNSNGVSFGINGNTITASVVGGGAPFAISGGTQSVSTGTVVFSNSNGVTFGMSGSSRMTASVAPETPFGISAGTQSGSTGTMVFSNSNGVSFGMSNSSVVTASFSQSAAPGAIAAGTQTATTGTVLFSNANRITFGMSASSQITAILNGNTWVQSLIFPNATDTGTQTNTAAITDFGQFLNSNGISWGLAGRTVTATADYVRSISAGTTNATGNQVVFSNSNGISFGASGQTITASVAGVPQPNVSYWDNRLAKVSNLVEVFTSGALLNMSFQRVSVPNGISATVLNLLALVSNTLSASGSYAISVGIYTMNHSTASLASSEARTASWASGVGTAFDYPGYSGNRWRSISLSPSWNLSGAGEYLIGIIATNQNIGTFAFYGEAAVSVDAFEPLTAISTQTNVNAGFRDGVYTTGTNALPASAALSEIYQSYGTNLLGGVVAQPYVQLIGTY